MNISIVTTEFKTIEMMASDIGIMPSSIHVWNGILNEDHYRQIDYDVFRKFCESVIYKKPNPDLAISQDDYYLSIPRENVDCIFVHNRRIE